MISWGDATTLHYQDQGRRSEAEMQYKRAQAATQESVRACWAAHAGAVARVPFRGVWSSSRSKCLAERSELAKSGANFAALLLQSRRAQDDGSSRVYCIFQSYVNIFYPCIINVYIYIYIYIGIYI